MSLNLNACAEDGEACKYSEALELHLQKLGLKRNDNHISGLSGPVNF
jgi:hypothetical protein